MFASVAAQPPKGLKLPPLDPNEALPPRQGTRPPAASSFDFVAAFKALKPLPKIHYSYAVEDKWLATANDPLVFEYVRLTHALCLRGERVTGPQVDVAAAVCAAVNAQKPAIPASIGINYSVWHARFAKDAPPTDVGRTHDDEIGFYRARLEQIRDWLDQSNRRRQTDIKVTAILLDCERFHIKEDKEPGAAVWNEAIRNKHDAIYDASKAVFPNARVVWYTLGGMFTGSTGNCWRTSNFAPTNIRNDCWSVSLYRPHEQHYTREQMRQTVEAARAAGVKDVIPWVPLGAGYRRQVEDRVWEWDNTWDYGLPIAWQMGAELNIPWYSQHADCYAPWNVAPFVCFYPGPFYPRNTYWPAYFVAYMRGANNVKEVDDISTGDGPPKPNDPDTDDERLPASGGEDPV